MSKTWSKVKLGDVLRRVERYETRDDLTEYQFAGTYSFARGIFVGERKLGATFQLPKIQRIITGDFIYCKIMAWEGAFGLVPKAANDCVMSGAFVVYEINKERLLPAFMDWYFRIPNTWRGIGSQSSGTNVRRQSLHPSQFELYEIPLPPLPEQRRIVARIEELAAKIAEAHSLRCKAIEEAEALNWSMKKQAFPEPADKVVKDFVRFQIGYAFKSDWFTDEGIRLARNANVSHGILDWSETVRIPESRRVEFSDFDLHLDDILISLDRPIISTGIKVAKIRKEDLPALLLQRVARPQFDPNRIDVNYLFHWLMSPRFVSAIDPGRSNGVPHISHKDIERIPFAAPPIAEQRRIVAYLDGLQAQVDALKRLQAETAAELDALLPSVLKKAFNGEL